MSNKQSQRQGIRMDNNCHHYGFEKGRIISRESFCQTQFQKPVNYSHTIRQPPDQYHIEAIKQYKKELDEMRRNYEELRRAYWYLLGYRIEGDERVPRVHLPRGKNSQCVTEGSQCNQPCYNLNISATDINQVISDIDDNRRKIDKLSDKMTQSIIEYRADSLLKPSNEMASLAKSVWNTKTKTENDEQLEEQLNYVLRQNKQLKDTLEKARQGFDAEAKEIKQSYEELLRKLEQILERERRHTKMLNGVIERLRSELGTKDSFIRNVMKIKGGDKNAMDRLIRQFKINT